MIRSCHLQPNRPVVPLEMKGQFFGYPPDRRSGAHPGLIGGHTNAFYFLLLINILTFGNIIALFEGGCQDPKSAGLVLKACETRTKMARIKGVDREAIERQIVIASLNEALTEMGRVG